MFKSDNLEEVLIGTNNSNGAKRVQAIRGTVMFDDQRVVDALLEHAKYDNNRGDRSSTALYAIHSLIALGLAENIKNIFHELTDMKQTDYSEQCANYLAEIIRTLSGTLDLSITGKLIDLILAITCEEVKGITWLIPQESVTLLMTMDQLYPPLFEAGRKLALDDERHGVQPEKTLPNF